MLHINKLNKTWIYVPGEVAASKEVDDHLIPKIAQYKDKRDDIDEWYNENINIVNRIVSELLHIIQFTNYIDNDNSISLTVNNFETLNVELIRWVYMNSYSSVK